MTKKVMIVGLGYNDLGLYDTSFITFYILWYELIGHKSRVCLLAQYDIREIFCVGCNDIASHLLQYNFPKSKLF